MDKDEIHDQRMRWGYWLNKQGVYQHITTIETARLRTMDRFLRIKGDKHNFRLKIRNELMHRAFESPP